jgi:hypothetical protein
MEGKRRISSTRETTEATSVGKKYGFVILGITISR